MRTFFPPDRIDVTTLCVPTWVSEIWGHYSSLSDATLLEDLFLKTAPDAIPFCSPSLSAVTQAPSETNWFTTNNLPVDGPLAKHQSFAHRSYKMKVLEESHLTSLTLCFISAWFPEGSCGCPWSSALWQEEGRGSQPETCRPSHQCRWLSTSSSQSSYWPEESGEKTPWCWGLPACWSGPGECLGALAVVGLPHEKACIHHVSLRNPWPHNTIILFLDIITEHKLTGPWATRAFLVFDLSPRWQIRTWGVASPLYFTLFRW